MPQELYAGIDLGTHHVATLTFSDGQRPMIYTSHPTLHNLAQQTEKRCKKSKEYGSQKGRVDNRKIQRFRDTAHRRRVSLLHKISRDIIKKCLDNKVKIIYIGWVSQRNGEMIQLQDILGMLQKNANDKGLTIKIIDESYTSQLSSYDLDDVDLNGIDSRIFSGKRLSPNDYQLKNGDIIQSDVNSSYNILRRGMSNAQYLEDELTKQYQCKEYRQPYYQKYKL